MTSDELPQCVCGKQLDRIDHYGIGHFILTDDVYRDVGILDGAADGGPGIASEVDLRCAYCGALLDEATRTYFYKRWVWALQAGRLVERDG